jgi:cytochrome c5
VRHLIVVLAVAASASSLAQELPVAPGRDDVVRRCVTCHETDLIAQQRLSTAGWGREVDKMTRWGAGVEAAEREAIVTYLTAHFGPAPASPVSASVEIESTYKRACRVCHETDLIEGQRLGRGGWTREVEKMIRWGAVVSDSEKSPLIDYLAGRFPVR